MERLPDSGMKIDATSKPLAIFEDWLAQAKKMSGVREATAMSLATVTKTGAVHSRMLLCKGWSEEGFKFYTNYNSPKGVEIENDAQVALLFYWDVWFRQIRIDGVAEKTSRQDSVAYWNSRARDSRLSQYISDQSAEVDSRESLEAKWRAAEKKFEGKEIPCPEHWGGYLVRPRTMEFWIGQPGRLHDRFEFRKMNADWTFRRLSP